MTLSTARITGINNKLGALTYDTDPQSTDLLIEDVIESNGGASFNVTVFTTDTTCNSNFSATIPVLYGSVVGGFQYEFDTAMGIIDNDVPNWFVKLCENMDPLFIPTGYSDSQCKIVEFLEQINDNRIISIVVNNTIITS